MNVLTTVDSPGTLLHLLQGRAGLFPAGSELDGDDASLEYDAGSIGSCGSDSDSDGDYEREDMEDMEQDGLEYVVHGCWRTWWTHGGGRGRQRR